MRGQKDIKNSWADKRTERQTKKGMDRKIGKKKNIYKTNRLVVR